jgi:hypothetical protein
MSLANTIVESTSTISGYGGVFTGSNLVIIILGTFVIVAFLIYKLAKLRHDTYLERIKSPYFCKPCSKWMVPKLGQIPHTNVQRQYFECPKCGKMSW